MKTLDKPIGRWTSIFRSEHSRPGVGVIGKTARFNLTTDTAVGYTNRRDWQSKCLGGDALIGTQAGGTATSTTATSLVNSGATFPTSGQGLLGHVVVGIVTAGTLVYGVIVAQPDSHTLTIDQWYDPTSTTLAAGGTPTGTTKYAIMPGGFPALMLALTADATAPSSADTTLASELTSNGFTRAPGTYSHSAAASSYKLQYVFTSTQASGSTVINKEAVLGAINTTAGGPMPFESAEPSPPTLVLNDQLTQSVSVAI